MICMQLLIQKINKVTKQIWYIVYLAIYRFHKLTEQFSQSYRVCIVFWKIVNKQTTGM